MTLIILFSGLKAPRGILLALGDLFETFAVLTYKKVSNAKFNGGELHEAGWPAVYVVNLISYSETR